jgi:hypothetical protein
VSDFSECRDQDQVMADAMKRVDGDQRHGMRLPWSKTDGARPFLGRGSESGRSPYTQLWNIPEADYPDSGMSHRHRPSSPPTQLYKRSAYSRSGPARSTHRLGPSPYSVSHRLPYKGESRRDDFESRKDTDFDEMVVYDPAVCDGSQNGDVGGRNQSGNLESQSGRRSDYYRSSDSSSESDSDSGSEHVTVQYDKDSGYINLRPDKVYRFVLKKVDGRK